MVESLRRGWNMAAAELPASGLGNWKLVLYLTLPYGQGKHQSASWPIRRVPTSTRRDLHPSTDIRTSVSSCVNRRQLTMLAAAPRAASRSDFCSPPPRNQPHHVHRDAIEHGYDRDKAG